MVGRRKGLLEVRGRGLTREKGAVVQWLNLLQALNPLG